MTTRRAALIGLLVVFGAALHVVESSVPLPVPWPGAKLGLANAATLVALSFSGPGAAIWVSVLRPLVGGLTGGGGGLMSMGFFLSFSGALVSALVMSGLWMVSRSRPARGPGAFSLTGVSVAGGAAHNLGQLAAASGYVGPTAALSYLGPLLLAGLVAGYLVGRLSAHVVCSKAVRMSAARLVSI